MARIASPAPPQGERCNCPSCGSPDTVNYHTIKSVADKHKREVEASKSFGLVNMKAMMESLYPNARKCVDCEFIWW